MEIDNEHFEIEATDPEMEQDRSVRARIRTIPKSVDRETAGWDERIKITGRMTEEYVNNVDDMFDLSDEERSELKKTIMTMKNDLRDIAHQKRIEEEVKGESEDDKEKKMEMMYRILQEGGRVKESDLEDQYPNIGEALEDEEGVLRISGELDLTDEGRVKVKEYYGFEAFEGDPEGEAVKQLEDNPLKYYLKSFDKVHKGDSLLKIWELCSSLSCTCSELQVHSWAVGPSGKGKSHIKRKLCECYLPEEMFEMKNSVSPKAMLYKTNNEGTDYLNEKLVFFDEVDDLEEVVTLLRSLTDQDEATIQHETVIDNELETLTLDVDKTTVWFTSVETIQDEQLKNRFILTNPDSSKSLDEEVYEWMHHRLHRGKDLDHMPKESPVIQRMVRNIREEVPGHKAIFPFEVEWKQKFNRRLYMFFYNLIELIAKIHYKNRIFKNGNIIATKGDFKLAALIWGRLVDTTVAQQDEETIKLLKELPSSRLEALNSTKLSERLEGYSPSKVRSKAKNLEESAEELNLIQSEKDEGRWVYWAGPDIKKLIDNEPEIRDDSKETMDKIFTDAGIEPTEELRSYVKDTDIPITSELREIYEESKNNIINEEEEGVEVTDEEKQVIEEFKDFNWSVDLNQLEGMVDDLKVIELATDLEEKDLIRIDGDNVPEKTSKLHDLRLEV